MEIKESYRVLELEVGATREAVEAAYCRLLERWHPDRAASGGGGPEAVREAQRMVQALNDAYQTLVKIAPGSAQASAPQPTNAPSTARAKPALPPWNAGPQASAHQPAPLPSTPAPSPAPAKPLPFQPAPMIPTPAASAPPPATTATPAFDFPTAQPKVTSALLRQAVAWYETILPAGSPRRRFAPIILAAAVLLFVTLIIVKFASKSPEEARAARQVIEAQTTGRLVVKSNLANTTVEAVLIPAAGMAAPAPRQGSVEGAAEQVLSALPPGKYSLTARAEGWPDIRQEADIEATRTTEVAIRFKSGSLRLVSDPAGATVKLGTAVLGETPLVIPHLPPGECPLTLVYQTWSVMPFHATITENVEVAMTVRLPHGKLTVESTPSGAAVNLEGRAVGKTPVTLERVPVGTMRLTLKAKDFPMLIATVRMVDRGDVKFSPALGSSFPALEPPALLQTVWVPEKEDQLAPTFDSVTGPYQPKNGIVKNLHRKRLVELWMDKKYRYSATAKSYDQKEGEIEFAEQKCDLSRYRVLVKLVPGIRADKDVVARLAEKDATVAIFGRLSAVEEPRWPSKVITLEFSEAELLP